VREGGGEAPINKGGKRELRGGDRRIKEDSRKVNGVII
jgi:hypothetical protein